MAYPRHSPAERGSPLSLRERNPPQADSWRERREVRTSPWLKYGKWPKTARNGPEWPTWSTNFLSGQRPIFGPPGHHLTRLPDTKRPKWPKMARKSKRIALFEDLKGGENPLTGPRLKPPKRLLVFPFPGNPVGAGHQANGNAVRAKLVVPTPAAYSNREKGRFSLVRQLNAFCRNQSAIALFGKHLHLTFDHRSCIFLN